MYASKVVHLPVVKYLVEQGAKVDIVDKVRTGEDIYAMVR